MEALVGASAKLALLDGRTQLQKHTLCCLKLACIRTTLKHTEDVDATRHACHGCWLRQTAPQASNQQEFMLSNIQQKEMRQKIASDTLSVKTPEWYTATTCSQHITATALGTCSSDTIASPHHSCKMRIAHLQCCPSRSM